MPRRSGTADLPLHYGRVPSWLADRMARLARIVVEAITYHYGREELLARLAHPFWFQAFGAVMGMDWHSSGMTTSVIGALKRGLADVEWELGIHVCGGRGRHSRKTPQELIQLGERTGLDGQRLATESRLVAKVDSAAVQDSFQLYLHGFVLGEDGNWVVVQQGMNVGLCQARRYHWQSKGLKSFVDEPHSGIAGPNRGTILNLTDRRAAPSRLVQVELASRPEFVVGSLKLPAHHEIRGGNVDLRRLQANLAAAAAAGPSDFQDLLMIPGVGARTIEALALVAEVVHGLPCRFSDPARFAYAHGGKDGHPFPVPVKVYDETLRVFRQALEKAKLGNDDRLDALRRLDAESRRLEKVVESGEEFAALLSRERQASSTYGGRTAASRATAEPRVKPKQLGLFD